jgi:dynein intermediate chain, cytosolic
MIISVSTDGVMCAWTTDMLARPQEYLELTYPPPLQSTTTTTLLSKVVDDLSPLTVAFSRNDSSTFYVGTEEGSIWNINRYDRAGAKAGTDSSLRFQNHFAPVTKVDLHKAGLGGGGNAGETTSEFDDLLLSTSLDWSVRLWRTRHATTTGSGNTGDIKTISPVIEWVREDMVYDVAWSPIRPSLFTTVDGSGALELWDLTSPDPEIPVAWTRDAGALNKVCWETGPEGRKVVTGALDGRVQVWDLGAEYGIEGSGGKEEVLGIKKFLARCEGERGIVGAGASERERRSSLSWR